MLKSICIKSNNKQTILYILDELEHLNLDNAYFSCHKFKNFTNVIIHYTGQNILLFLSSVSQILSYLVLDLYENTIIKNLISLDYFYFSNYEQKSIFDICINNLNYDNSLDRMKLLETSFLEYLSANKSINLQGFINFRLYKYIQYLDSIVDMCVNKFIIDKEYIEFIHLLREYVHSSNSSTDSMHLIYKNVESILLDSNNQIIPSNKAIFNAPYLSDISFSSNDYALNSLLTLLPNKLYIHLLCSEDEFIRTLKLVFEGRIYICHHCDVCDLYKKDLSKKV